MEEAKKLVDKDQAWHYRGYLVTAVLPRYCGTTAGVYRGSIKKKYRTVVTR
jgi:hypothetical protein